VSSFSDLSLLGIGPLHAMFGIPAVALVVLALVPNFRFGAAINVVASAAGFAAGVSLLLAERVRTDMILMDDFNIYLVTLTTFVAFTSSIFSATYIGHELAGGWLTPNSLRLYHALYQTMVGAMNVALLANNVVLLWVGMEVATLAAVMMVGIYRTPEAIEAAWKYFLLASVGIALALFGTILVYVAAQDALGDGLHAMAWDSLQANAAKFDPGLLSLAFVFILVGYGTKAGLAPFHAWLPDAHAEGPAVISAVLSGLLLNVALYALLRFKMLLTAAPGSFNAGMIMQALGLTSVLFGGFMLYGRRDIKRLFAYSSIGHMGIMTFAFGIGGPVANFSGLLHMTMHSLSKSAVFFAVGQVVQVKGTQRIAEIRGLSSTHPVLSAGLALGVIAIAGMPPFGMFLSEFMLVTSAFARESALAILLIVGLLLAFGALMLRLQDVLFGGPSGPAGKVTASYVPMFVHLMLVLIAGVWLPDSVVRWFRAVAAQLG
jgi:hydrogenase-4 component F